MISPQPIEDAEDKPKSESVFVEFHNSAAGPSTSKEGSNSGTVTTKAHIISSIYSINDAATSINPAFSNDRKSINFHNASLTSSAGSILTQTPANSHKADRLSQLTQQTLFSRQHSPRDSLASRHSYHLPPSHQSEMSAHSCSALQTSSRTDISASSENTELTSFSAKIKHSLSMAGAMRWVCVKPYCLDDYKSKFVQMRNHRAFNIDEKVYIHCELTVTPQSPVSTTIKTSSCLILFDMSSLTWSMPEQFGDIPPPLKSQSFTYIGGNQAVMFGGGHDSVYFNDVYLLNIETFVWTHITKQQSQHWPSGRRAHSACFVKSRGKVYVFGGGNGEIALNDLWSLEIKPDGKGCVWEEIQVSGEKPMPRGYSSLVTTDEKLILFGGSDGRKDYGDAFVFDLTDNWWHLCYSNPQKPRMGHSCSILGNYLFIIGGGRRNQYTSDIHVVNLLSWNIEDKPISTVGQQFDPRGFHISILFDSRIFVFGGYNGKEVLGDVWMLELANQSFLQKIVGYQVGIVSVNPTTTKPQ